MAANYVRFYRGSPEAYANVIKNDDTLYFVYSSDSDKGSLYLGDRLISGNVSNITDLEDLIITELQDKQILQYDIAQSAWVNKSIREAIGVMTGASEDSQGSIGLVPAPGIGKQNLFLRGDGVWASPGASSSTDDKSITTVDNVLTLKDFGVKYYKYVEATGSEETSDFVPAHYEAQIVDGTHPWLEGLEPKVVNDNGNLVIGWFEPNTITVDGLSDAVNNLSNQVNKNTQSISNITQQLSDKANSSDVYTKTETDDLIAEKVASASHLKREVFNTILQATAFAESHAETADQYIYMVLNPDSDNENDKYDEYLYVNGSLEKVGSWAVDLSQYVKKEEGKSLVSNTEIAKLATVEQGAQKNYITSVSSEFEVDENKQLKLVSIPPALNLNTNRSFKALDTRVGNIENILNDNESAGTQGLVTKVTNLQNALDNLGNKYVTTTLYKAQVGNLSNLIHASGKAHSPIVDELNDINDRLEWKELK